MWGCKCYIADRPLRFCPCGGDASRGTEGGWRQRERERGGEGEREEERKRWCESVRENKDEKGDDEYGSTAGIRTTAEYELPGRDEAVPAEHRGRPVQVTRT